MVYTNNTIIISRVDTLKTDRFLNYYSVYFGVAYNVILMYGSTIILYTGF